MRADSSSPVEGWKVVVNSPIAEPAPKLGGIDYETKNRRLKRKFARVTEERDLLKKGTAYYARETH